jgi:hypothetical protein
MKPHKHAEAIKAWADGAEIEYRAQGSQEWKPIFEGWSWDNSLVAECRIKPKLKPDTISFLCVLDPSGIVFSMVGANLKLTFDGETGKLKSAEVI